MAQVKLENVSKVYDGHVKAVNDADLLLRGFIWLEERRPLGQPDIFVW